MKKEKTVKPAANYGSTADEIFYYSTQAKGEFGDIPKGSLGFYSYYQRLATGLRQIMAGSRRQNLSDLTRDDIFSLTRECEEVTGIAYIMDYDREKSERILDA